MRGDRDSCAQVMQEAWHHLCIFMRTIQGTNRDKKRYKGALTLRSERPFGTAKSTLTRNRLRRLGTSAACIVLGPTLFGVQLRRAAKAGHNAVKNELEAEITAEILRDSAPHTSTAMAVTGLPNYMELPSSLAET